MDLSPVDAYAPLEIAKRVEEAGVKKGSMGLAALIPLAVLAGAFIGLGAMLSTVAATDPRLGYGPSRLLAGVAFSLGLILVVIAGAELFTGNNLLVMAWADRRLSTAKLLRNWFWAYVGNMVGAVGTAVAWWLSLRWQDGGGAVGATAMKIALAKCSLGFGTAFVLGALCNALVCLAVWLCFSARSTTDKILSILFPITAFVALGFEHSVANMYFIPLGMLLKTEPVVLQAGGWTSEALAAVGWGGFARNLVPVTLGNIAGGSVMVALVYWFVYLRGARKADGTA